MPGEWITFSSFIVFIFFLSCGNIGVKTPQNQTNIRKTETQQSAKRREGLVLATLLLKASKDSLCWRHQTQRYLSVIIKGVIMKGVIMKAFSIRQLLLTN